MSVCIRCAPMAQAARGGLVGPRVRVPAAAGLAAAAAVAVVAAALWMRPARMPITLDSAAAPAGVEITDATVDRSYGYVSVVGQVRNGSTHALHGAGVLVELLDGQGRVRGVESSLLEPAAVPPHGVAPFRVFVADDRDAAACRAIYRQIVPGDPL